MAPGCGLPQLLAPQSRLLEPRTGAGKDDEVTCGSRRHGLVSGAADGGHCAPRAGEDVAPSSIGTAA